MRSRCLNPAVLHLLTQIGFAKDNRQLMSVSVSDLLDFARAVQTGWVLEGEIEIAQLPRVAEAVAEPVGRISYRVSFDRGELNMARVRVECSGELVVQCQRSLEAFALPVSVDTLLSPVRDDADAAALPEGWEPMELDADGRVRPSDLLEDELLLALPAVPKKPGLEDEPLHWEARDPDDLGPFAALKSLRN